MFLSSGEYSLLGVGDAIFSRLGRGSCVCVHVYIHTCVLIFACVF